MCIVIKLIDGSGFKPLKKLFKQGDLRQFWFDSPLIIETFQKITSKADFRFYWDWYPDKCGWWSAEWTYGPNLLWS